MRVFADVNGQRWSREHGETWRHQRGVEDQTPGIPVKNPPSDVTWALDQAYDRWREEYTRKVQNALALGKLEQLHEEAKREDRERGRAEHLKSWPFASRLSVSRVVIPNPTPAEAFVMSCYQGLGTLRGKHGRVFHIEGEPFHRNSSSFALTLRDRFFPEHPLVVEEDEEGTRFDFARATCYWLHATLRRAGSRAVADHVRGSDAGSLAHARPRPIEGAIEASA